MGIFDNFSLDQFAGGLSSGLQTGTRIGSQRSAAAAQRAQAANAQKLAEGRLKLQQDQFGLQKGAAGRAERKFEAEQAATAKASEQKLGQDLAQTLSIQNAIDAQRRTGGLDEQQISQINAAGGGPEQAALLNELIAGTQAEQAAAPLRDLEQQKLVADIGAQDALTQERLRPPAAPEAFDQVPGSALGLKGPDADKIFNVSGKTGKVTPIGGGGVTVNTGDKVDQIRQTEKVKSGIKRSNQIADELDTLADNETTISRLQELSPEAAAGFGVTATPLAKAFENITGIDTPSNVAATEEFQAGASTLVRDAAKDLKGSLSDKDLELLQQSGPSLLQSREGRDQILSTIAKGNTIKRNRLQEEARLLDEEGLSRVEAKKRAKEAFPPDGAGGAAGKFNLSSSGGTKYRVVQ